MRKGQGTKVETSLHIRDFSSWQNKCTVIKMPRIQGEGEERNNSQIF